MLTENRETNTQGQFELSGYEGYTYRVVSTGDKTLLEGKQEEVYGMSDQFKLTGEAENLKIVLSARGRPWEGPE